MAKAQILNPVEEYILNQSEEFIPVLEKVRKIILSAAPGVQEGISYGMPAYKLCGKPLVYFAAQKKHLGFYATPSAHEKFAVELSAFKHGKGSVQFPINKSIPYDMIEKITIYRVEENKAYSK